MLNSQIKYNLKCDKYILNKSRSILFDQVRVKETFGKNDSREIRTYLSSVVIFYPAPYCAAGQYYCFCQASKLLNKDTNNISLKRTGLANAMMNDAIKKGNKNIFIPKDNDLIIWKNINNNFGHIERIIEVNKAGWVKTIGFNTSGRNPREGDGVYIKNRNIYYYLSRMKVRGLIGWEEI